MCIRDRKSWRRLYRLPQYDKADARLFAAADVLAEILGGGLTGRLYQRLVADDRLATGIGAYADTARLDNGEYMFYASLAPKTPFEAVAVALDDEIKKAQTELVSETELARAKMQLVSDVIFARDSQQTMAQIFGQAAMLGLSAQDVLDWPRRIEAVTAQDVRQAARTLLQRNHSLTGHLQPARGR